MNQDNMSDVELAALGRTVRNTFREIVAEENLIKRGKRSYPRSNPSQQTLDSFIKIGRLVAKHEADPVVYATVVRNYKTRTGDFFFNHYHSANIVDRAFKEAKAKLHTMQAVGQQATPRNEEDVMLLQIPAVGELISRIASAKTFLMLRNRGCSMNEENLNTMADPIMDMDPLACLLLSRGAEPVWSHHYEEAMVEISTRPDILSAIRKKKLNWEGFLD